MPAYILKQWPCKTLKSPMEACASLLATLDPHSTPGVRDEIGVMWCAGRGTSGYMCVLVCACIDLYCSNKTKMKHNTHLQLFYTTIGRHQGWRWQVWKYQSSTAYSPSVLEGGGYSSCIITYLHFWLWFWLLFKLPIVSLTVLCKWISEPVE